ncbi:YaaC family protein [Rhodopirellula sp. JC639]|uniref:YaaC family protein n=1 Tax=Stieleria mannarensis TaxID=2755585 RepID=UPI0016002E5E|nr:YaaC family protein [Rhodopirellula sp. JC639]
MKRESISIRGRAVTLHSAILNPKFSSSTVLSPDPWDYVLLWLQREHKDDARFYWDQARQFYRASTMLPHTASPLTSYYCFLNATKALLSTRSQLPSPDHGVAGDVSSGHCALVNERVTFKTGGVLPALCRLLGEGYQSESTYDMNLLFWNLPFIHRAYTKTYSSASELFLPVESHGFTRKKNSTETWYWGSVPKRYITGKTEVTLPKGFEVDNGISDRWVFRRKQRFKWNGRDLKTSLEALARYHRAVRTRIFPIYATKNRWYLKKAIKNADVVSHSPLPIMFACMHRLSELSRYDPQRLARHLELQHNWLLAEFLGCAPAQFVHGIAAEITGDEFLVPSSFRMDGVSRT